MWRSRRKRDGGCRGGLPRATAEEKKRESDNCTTWLYMFVCMLICHGMLEICFVTIPKFLLYFFKTYLDS